jgi:hypothetical protein
MNWDAIGAVAEAIGAVGVIASLLYLAMQVRAGARASAVESKLASTRGYTEFLDSLIESPELNDLFLRGRQGTESLTPQEYIRFSNLSLKSFSIFSAGHFQFRQGTLSDSDWFENRAIVRFWLRGPGCRQWWDQVGQHMFGADFVAYVESEMPRSDTASKGVEQA